MASTVPAIAIVLAFLMIMIGVLLKENALVIFGLLFLFFGVLMQIMFLMSRGKGRVFRR